MKDDKLLKLDVEEEFASEAGLDPSRITLKINQGVLSLCGTVASFSEKLVAERAAARVVGQQSVRNMIAVGLPIEARRPDGEIRTSCRAALIESYGVPRDAIEPIVLDGRVTLEGRVRSKYERDAALHAICEVRGIVDVIDHMTIETHAVNRNLPKSAGKTV